MAKVYKGERTTDGCVVIVEERETREGMSDKLVRYGLPPRLDIRNHSPSGFEWGYGGSGPAQLALALLVDHLGDTPEARERAERLYQPFKFMVVGRLQHESWELAAERIDAVVAELERTRPMATGGEAGE